MTKKMNLVPTIDASLSRVLTWTGKSTAGAPAKSLFGLPNGDFARVASRLPERFNLVRGTELLRFELEEVDVKGGYAYYEAITDDDVVEITVTL